MTNLLRLSGITNVFFVDFQQETTIDLMMLELINFFHSSGVLVTIQNEITVEKNTSRLETN